MNIKTAFNAEHSAKNTAETIKGQIRILAKALFQLAPAPNRSGHHGPVFISLNSAFQPASDSDGLMGGLMLEGFLGGVFSQVSAFSNDNNALGSAASMLHHDIVDMASHYIEDRAESSHNNYGHGRGSIALYEHKTRPVLSPSNDMNDATAAYQTDLPQRLRIESHIASLMRDIDACCP